MSNKKTVLVTGASGQLGRRLVRELLRHGFRVRAHYRSQEKADRYCPPEAKPVLGDIVTPDWLDKAVNGCDYVIHGAAKVSLRPLKNPDYMYRVNVEGTRAVIDACKNSAVKRLLHVSSVAAVGGSVNGQPLNEEAVFNCAGYGIPYFETKHDAEILALEANDDFLEVVVVNPSIMISPPDRKLTKKDLKKIPNRVPAYFDFGFNLVETADVIDGIIKAMEKGRPGERYILAGENLDPEKAFKLAEKYFGIKKPVIKIPLWSLYIIGMIAEIVYLFKSKKPSLNRRASKLLKMKFVYTSDKARSELGYIPRSLAESIERILSNIDESQDNTKPSLN